MLFGFWCFVSFFFGQWPIFKCSMLRVESFSLCKLRKWHSINAIKKSTYNIIMLFSTNTIILYNKCCLHMKVLVLLAGQNTFIIQQLIEHGTIVYVAGSIYIQKNIFCIKTEAYGVTVWTYRFLKALYNLKLYWSCNMVMCMSFSCVSLLSFFIHFFLHKRIL